MVVLRQDSSELSVNSVDTEQVTHRRTNHKKWNNNNNNNDAKHYQGVSLTDKGGGYNTTTAATTTTVDLNFDKLQSNSIDAVLSLLNNSNNERAEARKGTTTNKDNQKSSWINDPSLKQPSLSVKARTQLETIHRQMRDPTKSIAELISAISKPENKEYSRGYMVRRKNACGAIQVLTTKKESNRIQVCWTKGVLPALKSVLEDGVCENLAEKFPNVQTRCEYIEARKRAVATLVTMAIPQENRLIVYHCPKLVEVIIATTHHADDECRKGGAAILAHLAKLKDNRLFMTRVPGFFEAAIDIIAPKDSYNFLGDIVESQTDPSTLGVSKSTLGASKSTLGYYSYDSQDSENDESYDSDDDDDDRDDDEKSHSRRHVSPAQRYENIADQHLKGARQNIFALLLHLVKEKDNNYIFAREKKVIVTLSEIAKLMDCTSQEYACKIIANLTRHHGNTKVLVLEEQSVVPALLKASYSQNDETRKYVCYALQNLSQDPCCRRELVEVDKLLHTLCVRIRQAYDPEERLAAIHALKNLTEEPGNLIPMANTPECFPTLMQIADARDDNVTEMMRYVGCDALANLSHWFRLLATNGRDIDRQKRGEPSTSTRSKELFVPSLKQITWEQWE